MKKYTYISIKFLTYYSTNKRVGLALLADYLKITNHFEYGVIFKKIFMAFPIRPHPATWYVKAKYSSVRARSSDGKAIGCIELSNTKVSFTL